MVSAFLQGVAAAALTAQLGAAPPASNLPTLVWAEGWAGANGYWPPFTTLNSSGSALTGRYGAGSFAFQITGSGARSVLIQPGGMSGDWLYLGTNVLWSTEGQAVVLAINRGAAGTTSQSVNTCVRFRMETNGDLTVLDSTGATIGTLTGFGGSYHWLSVELNAVDAGQITVAVDGSVILNAVSGDFAGSSATGTTWAFWFTDDQDTGSDNSSSTRLGETFIGIGDGTNDLWDEVRGYTLLPTGDDTTTNWTPNTGTQWQATDEQTADNDTTYISTSTDAAEFFNAMGDGPGTGVIAAVVGQCNARRTTGSMTIQAALKATTTHYGASRSLGTGYAPSGVYLRDNPDTSAAWTHSDVAGIRCGAKVAGAGDCRVTNTIGQVFIYQ